MDNTNAHTAHMSFGHPSTQNQTPQGQQHHGQFMNNGDAIDPGLGEATPMRTGTSLSGGHAGQFSRMDPPPAAVYSSLDELISQANAHAASRGYKFVVVRSKTNTQGQKTWVHLACDRHGTKRNTHNLTPETRKKNRRSRRCECPMYCVANKTASELWELSVRNAEHNHGPYEAPPKKKKDLPQPHSSELVNLPLLQTPSHCAADFCLVPIGLGTPSVSAEIAEVQRLLKRSGLHYTMHGSGTTVEGSWDEVTRIIGQAHSLLHGSGIVRIQTDLRIGTRTDKKQSYADKIAAVNALLEGEEAMSAAAAAAAASDDGNNPNGDDNEGTPTHQQQHHHHAAAAAAHHQSLSHALTHNINSAMAPDMDRVGMAGHAGLNPHAASMHIGGHVHHGIAPGMQIS